MDSRPQRVSLGTIAREWTRLGCIGFGGPPAHIALLRRLCVEDRQWMSDRDFEDGVAATNLLPGPASTQLAIYCAWRLRGRRGRGHWRCLLHRAGVGPHLGPVGAFPRSSRPGVDIGYRGGCGRRDPRGGVESRMERSSRRVARARDDAPHSLVGLRRARGPPRPPPSVRTSCWCSSRAGWSRSPSVVATSRMLLRQRGA